MFHNANRWFLLGASLIMLGVGIVGILYYKDIEFPFASGNRYVWLYRINYVILTWIILTSSNEKWVRMYGILSGWFMIYLVVGTWFQLPPATMFKLTAADNLLHTNLGLSSIFFALFFSEAKKNTTIEEEDDSDEDLL
ncbi:MAG: hypothetical protein U0U66_10215 [Cytophagaceae bacterium]